MPITGSNSIASQIYSAIQGRQQDRVQQPVREKSAPSTKASEEGGERFRLPVSATPKGDWVLSENVNPQAFDSNAPRGSYLNVVV
jgi:hypothetical protein